MKKRFWILAIIYAWFGRDGARSQQKQPVSSLQEDCGVTFSFTAASSGAQAAGTTTAGSTGTTAVIDNRQVGCLDWVVTYETSSVVTVISLAFQTALDVGGIPTTWSNYPGTLSSGINPNTAVTTGGAVTEATGVQYPFLRMNLTALTGAGTVSGTLKGWKRRPGSSGVGGGCAGTAASPCIVAGPDAIATNPTKNPVFVGGQELVSGDIRPLSINDATKALNMNIQADTGVATGFATAQADGATNSPTLRSAAGVASTNRSYPYNFNGSTWDRQLACSSSAFVNLSGSGNTEIVALTALQSVHLCEIYFSTTAPEDIKLTSGTGTNCGTGTADLGPLFKSVQSGRIQFNGREVVGPAGAAICMNQSVAQANGVWVTYAKF